MNKPLFTGVCTALVTPFLSGEVNYPMMEMLLRRQLEAGVKAVVICGTTGESATLSDGEKVELFRRCKDYVSDQMCVIAGTGSNSTEHSVWLSREAEKAGVDGLLVVSPYYNKATNDGLEAHYLSIAHNVKLPVILYNVPSRTGMEIPVSVYKSLSRIPNIVGVKEASTDLAKIAKIRRECGNHFSIWSGNDDLTVPILSLGGQGVISVLSNVCPAETVAMVLSAMNGDFTTAAAMQCKLLPLMELLFCEVNPILVKAILRKIGYDCGGCRLPLTEISEPNAKKIRMYFESNDSSVL